MKNIIFFDGDCGFCNSTVQFILNKRKREFYFLPLQSNRAKDILDKYSITITMDTIYLLKEDKVYEKSSAALQIARGLKGLYPLMIGFYILPKFIRDYFYTLIAKRRHKIRNNYCLVPSPEDKKYIIYE